MNWPRWMEDDVLQWLIVISIAIITIIVSIVLKFWTKHSSKVSSINGDDNIQVINSPGTIINKVNQIKHDHSDYQLVLDLKQEMKAKTNRECSQREIEGIYSSIYNHVTSLDYAKAIKAYEDNRDMLDFHKDKYKELIEQIEILISEAKNE